MRPSSIAALTFAIAMISASPTRAQTSAGAAVTGRYRNLFVEAGQTPAEVSARIEKTFQQLFHGDSANETVYYSAGQNANGPLAYVTDINNHDVRTEGMSYGMMIAVQLDKKPEFDALWNWAQTYMYHDDPQHPSFGFFSWSMKTNGTPNSESPAPDGEEYFAMALYFASARWGNGAGIYDYRGAADRLLTDMRHRGLISRRESNGRTETERAEFNPEQKMVRFTPDTLRRDHTDPSYHLPAFYELWARWGPEVDRDFWKDAAAQSRDFFQKTANPKTGLTPDYANFDGTPVGFGPQHFGSTFAADAWRTAANWSVDWAWWAADPRERALSDRIQSFFMSKGIDRYGSKYSLDGMQVNDTAHATALVATNAIAGLAATDQSRAAKFVAALWNTPIPSGQYRYYDGLWYLMALIHDGGAFRVWAPSR
jgi:oligosaccharide reducing-end xylanase